MLSSLKLLILLRIRDLEHLKMIKIGEIRNLGISRLWQV